jgi:hypothetical protein
MAGGTMNFLIPDCFHAARFFSFGALGPFDFQRAGAKAIVLCNNGDIINDSCPKMAGELYCLVH